MSYSVKHFNDYIFYRSLLLIKHLQWLIEEANSLNRFITFEVDIYLSNMAIELVKNEVNLSSRKNQSLQLSLP